MLVNYYIQIDKKMGDCAVIACPNGRFDYEDIAAWCRSRLAEYKVPRSVVFVDALPRTASGKVKKDVLRKVIEAEVGAS